MQILQNPSYNHPGFFKSISCNIHQTYKSNTKSIVFRYNILLTKYIICNIFNIIFLYGVNENQWNG